MSCVLLVCERAPVLDFICAGMGMVEGSVCGSDFLIVCVEIRVCGWISFRIAVVLWRGRGVGGGGGLQI
jgi:hypothetical protein